MRFFRLLILALFLAAVFGAPVFAENSKKDTKKIEAAAGFDKAVVSDAPCELPAPLCGDKPKFGGYWNSLGETERKTLLRGFDVGLFAAWQTSYLEGGEAGNIRAGVFDRRLNMSETYAGTGIDFIVNYFNNFYADAANDTIDWSYAWLLASLAFQEKNAEDNGAHDEAYLKKFLQTYGELPGWVRITGVKSADKIDVEVLVPEPYHLTIKLRGVAEKNGDGQIMTEEQTQRAMKFIQGLAATRGYPFKNCACTEMVRPQLYYGSSFFTADGTLQAYVRLSESSFCLIKDEVQASELSTVRQENSFVLNEALLTAGLAYVDEEASDYQESDRLLQSVDKAREKGLNLYGKSRLPAVEKVIKQGAKPVNQNCLP